MNAKKSIVLICAIALSSGCATSKNHKQASAQQPQTLTASAEASDNAQASANAEATANTQATAGDEAATAAGAQGVAANFAGTWNTAATANQQDLHSSSSTDASVPSRWERAICAHGLPRSSSR